MRAQPTRYRARPPEADAMPVEPDTLDAIADWVRDAARDGTRATVIGCRYDPTPPALYLDQPAAPTSLRVALGSWLVIDARGTVLVYGGDEAFRAAWERPERPERDR